MRHVVALLALVASSPAHAEDAPGTSGPIAVRGHLDGTSGELAVRYVIAVDGPAVHHQVAELDLPVHGMVTGAIATVDGAVHRLALDPKEHAGHAIDALETEPAGPHRRWAIHLATLGSAGPISLDVAAPHAARITLDLEVAAPTCFVDDMRYVAIPSAWRPALARELVVASRRDLDTRCDPELGEDHAWVGLPSRELSTRPFGDERIGTTSGRLDLSSDHVARVELALAQRISQVPPDLATAFVVDGSRSMSAPQRAAQAAIIASYLRLAPQSRVQVIAYARKARAVLPGWMTASQAAARVTRELAALAGANGSNLDLGLETASTWLARQGGTRRIVVFTDELVSERVMALEIEALRTKLPEGTLVHVVALAGDTGTIDRDDDVLFGALAKLTEGIGVHGRVDDRGHADATKLVRPIALEQIKLHGPGWAPLAPGVPVQCRLDSDPTLGEGQACEWWAHGATTGPVLLDGVVWNHRVARVLRPDPSTSRTLARSLSVFGAGLGDALEREIDRAAFAIDSVWSLIGSWGGTGGYADISKESFGFGTCGCGGGGGSSDSIGIGHMGPRAIKIDLQAQLQAAIDARCHRGTARVDIALELTLDEIVDVTVATTPELHDCVTEAVWDTAIVLAHPISHTHTSVTIGA